MTKLKEVTEDQAANDQTQVAENVQETPKMETPETVQEAEKVTMVQMPESVFSNIGQMLKNSEMLETATKTVELMPEYFEFAKVGDAVRGIYLGTVENTFLNQKTGELETKISVQWITNRKIYFNSGYKLVQGIAKSGIKTGTPIEISFTGKTGNTKNYSVSLLG